MQTEPPTARTWEQECDDEAALWNARIELPAVELASYGSSELLFRPERAFRFGCLLVDGPPGVRVLSFQVANDERLVGPKVPIELFGPDHQRPTWIATIQPSEEARFQLQNVAKAARRLRAVAFGSWL